MQNNLCQRNIPYGALNLRKFNKKEKGPGGSPDKEKKHLEAIDTLKFLVLKLREERASTSSECQTFFEDIRIPCNYCIYNATCEEDLNWHMRDEHEVSSDLYLDTDFYMWKMVHIKTGSGLPPKETLGKLEVS